MKRNKRKDHTPLILRFIRWWFPKAEKYAPGFAAKYFRKIFFTPLRYKIPEKERPLMDSAEKFSLLLEGRHIQGYKWGSGTPVFLLHGWAGRAAQFRQFIPALTKAGYQAIAIDGPSHGQSEGEQTNILEFEQVITQVYNQFQPVAAIAHSFGGVAVIFACSRGLPLGKLITIASPSIGDEVVNTYLRAINGSRPTGEAFKKYLFNTYGKTFDEFSSLYLVTQLPHPLKLMIVQDDDDKEVIPLHATELKKVYPQALLLQTQGLGHTRILRDEQVISRSIDFIARE
jgi:pimeloyl-ACP methyl ester carboxylesterase